jgi:hypothetical protein
MIKNHYLVVGTQAGSGAVQALFCEAHDESEAQAGFEAFAYRDEKDPQGAIQEAIRACGHSVFIDFVVRSSAPMTIVSRGS